MRGDETNRLARAGEIKERHGAGASRHGTGGEEAGCVEFDAGRIQKRDMGIWVAGNIVQRMNLVSREQAIPQLRGRDTGDFAQRDHLHCAVL